MSKTRTIDTEPVQIQIIKTNERHPNGGLIQLNDLYGKGVGRFIAPLERSTSWSSDPIFDKFHNLLNGRGDGKNTAEKIQRRLAADLNYNRIERLMSEKCHGRAVSTFYTIDEKNRLLIVEWGKIDPDTDEGKLHGSLRSAVDYYERARNGMKIVSGHMAPIDGSGKVFALMDSIDHSSTQPHSFSRTELTLIDSLHSQGFLPLTARGRLLATSLVLGYSQ